MHRLHLARFVAPACVAAALWFAPGAAAAQAPAPAATPGPPTTAAPQAPSPAATPLPPAGIVPADATVELAGIVSADFALARIRQAIDAQTGRVAGTALDVHGIDVPATLQPGDALEAQAGVHIDGRGTAQNVDGRTNVHLHVRALPELDPQLLWYSDDPEYVGPTDDGVLYRGTIDPDAPVRVFAYHVATGAARRVALVLTGGGFAQRVQVLGTIAGPSPGYAYIGQRSSARFLLARATQESAIVTVQPGMPYVIPLATLQPGDLVEAILDLRILDGGPVDAAIVTAATGAPMPASLGAPEIADDTHGRRGAFALTGIPPIELSFSAGGSEPAPLPVGEPGLPNLRPGGRPLAGDYGLVRPVVLTLSNPAAGPQTVYLYATPAGGAATVTMLFSGDAAATTIPCIADPAIRYSIKAFTLAGGEQQTVTGTFMTDGASTYPLLIGLTSTPPSVAQPDGCNSAGPTASPSPAAGSAPAATPPP